MGPFPAMEYNGLYLKSDRPSGGKLLAVISGRYEEIIVIALTHIDEPYVDQ
jgi:hypothetical protein